MSVKVADVQRPLPAARRDADAVAPPRRYQLLDAAGGADQVGRRVEEQRRHGEPVGAEGGRRALVVHRRVRVQHAQVRAQQCLHRRLDARPDEQRAADAVRNPGHVDGTVEDLTAQASRRRRVLFVRQQPTERLAVQVPADGEAVYDQRLARAVAGDDEVEDLVDDDVRPTRPHHLQRPDLDVQHIVAALRVVVAVAVDVARLRRQPAVHDDDRAMLGREGGVGATERQVTADDLRPAIRRRRHRRPGEQQLNCSRIAQHL